MYLYRKLNNNSMKIRNICLVLGLLLSFAPGRADEGMWLMQQLAKQYGKMQERGLKLKEYDVYNPNGSSLKDAVVIFGSGCTGELISSQGLVLTNHHCGYDAIQGLSSVEHNYLEDGYWAQSFDEELPARGLSVTFIDAIEDVTDYVVAALKKDKKADAMAYLSPTYLSVLASRKVGKLPQGVEVEIKAFYNGNRYLMFTKKIYTDIRFVAAPPSAIGKFGADTDNWVYPRHTGDFSIFRIYADAEGNPAAYSSTNKPLHPKRWFNISTKGVEQGDFAMIMGFPGRTNRFYIPEEVQEWKTIDNDIRIRIRAIRQEVMLGEMHKDPKVNIQYASKYAMSQNAYKRAIGANWGIDVRQLGEDKRRQMQSLLDYAMDKDKALYEVAIGDIRSAIQERASLRRRLWYILESFVYGTEFIGLPKLAKSIDEDEVKDFYKDFNPEVDRKITLAVLTEYLKQIRVEERPAELNEMLAELGSPEALVSLLFKSSYTTYEGLQRLRQQKASTREAGTQPVYEVIQVGGKALMPDKMLERFASMVRQEQSNLVAALKAYDDKIERARYTYVGGLLKQIGSDNLWPDANSTLRFTYGNIKGYKPRDAVQYSAFTTLDGVMAKADSTSWEFAVPKRLQEIYQRQSYGKGNRWAVKDATGKWVMPVNMSATTHTTGGNSGSPVLDAYGNLIGINFDRNWEGVGGDIQYLGDYQRSIICDIRYILMLIEEYGKCPRLLDEMSFAD